MSGEWDQMSSRLLLDNWRGQSFRTETGKVTRDKIEPGARPLVPTAGVAGAWSPVDDDEAEAHYHKEEANASEAGSLEERGEKERPDWPDNPLSCNTLLSTCVRLVRSFLSSSLLFFVFSPLYTRCLPRFWATRTKVLLLWAWYECRRQLGRWIWDKGQMWRLRSKQNSQIKRGLSIISADRVTI